MAEIDGGRPRLADGRVLEAANGVWCIRVQPDVTCLAPDRRTAVAAHREGRVEGEPGLDLIGMALPDQAGVCLSWAVWAQTQRYSWAHEGAQWANRARQAGEVTGLKCTLRTLNP